MCTMRSITGPQWVTGKLPFLRIARNTFYRRFYNALGVCSIFCKLEVCIMHGDFALCGSLGKSNLNSSGQLKP